MCILETVSLLIDANVRQLPSPASKKEQVFSVFLLLRCDALMSSFASAGRSTTHGDASEEDIC